MISNNNNNNSIKLDTLKRTYHYNSDYLVYNFLNGLMFSSCYLTNLLHPKISDYNILKLKDKIKFVTKNSIAVSSLISFSIYLNNIVLEQKEDIVKHIKVLNNELLFRLLSSLFSSSITLFPMSFFYFFKYKNYVVTKDNFVYFLGLMSFLNIITYNNKKNITNNTNNIL